MIKDREHENRVALVKLLEFIAEKRQDQKAIESGDLVHVADLVKDTDWSVRKKAVELWPWLSSRKELGSPTDLRGWYDSGNLYVQSKAPYYTRYLRGTFLGNLMLRDDLDDYDRKKVIEAFCELGADEGDEGYLDYWVMQWLARRWPTTPKFITDVVMLIVGRDDPSQALELFKRVSPTSTNTVDRAYTEDGQNMDIVRWIFWKCWERLRECPEKLTADQRLSLLRCVSGEEDERLVLDVICKHDIVLPIKENEQKTNAQHVLFLLRYEENVRRLFEHVGRGPLDKEFRDCRQCPEEIKALLTLAR